MIAMPTLISVGVTPWPRFFNLAAPAAPAMASTSAATVAETTPIFHFDGRLMSVRAMLSPPDVVWWARAYDARGSLSRHRRGTGPDGGCSSFDDERFLVRGPSGARPHGGRRRRGAHLDRGRAPGRREPPRARAAGTGRAHGRPGRDPHPEPRRAAANAPRRL